MTKTSPFITAKYLSEKYFCDRIKETKQLTQLITNENNVALISPWRLGKTGLIEHCFHQKEITQDYCKHSSSFALERETSINLYNC